VKAAVQYEAATGAMLNLSESKAIALGTWDTATPIIGIEYHNQIKVLGINFTNTIRLSAANSWTHLAQNIRIQSQDAYYRELSLHQRVQYVNIYLLAKAWYTAQVFQAANERYPANRHSSFLVHMARTNVSSANVHALQN
jgi:hypothetical protein